MNPHLQPGGLLMPGSPVPAYHPIANLFPMLEDDRRPSFRASLAEGQNHPIILHKGMILDGRNRARELIELKKPISFAVFVGTDREALDFVNAENLERRHLSETVRAMIAATVAGFRVGTNQHTAKPAQICAPSLFEPEAETPAPEQRLMSQTEAAEAYSVSRRLVQTATVVKDKGIPDLQQAVMEDKIAVSAAVKIAKLPEAEQPAALEKALPNGNRAIMSSRQEPDDSLDFFPTPPWATRALVERVLMNADLLGTKLADALTHDKLHVWEPACGEGHMAEVLREYYADVLATDIHDYGYGDGKIDFTSDLEAGSISDRAELIVTNPPFGEKSEAFVLQALRQADLGVAMFVRLQWLETLGRYERIFKDHPPTLIAFFPERVNLCKGRWDPEGGTATAYIWLLWLKGVEPMPPFWIPPGCREALTKPDDAVRFTQHPVQKRDAAPAAEAAE